MNKNNAPDTIHWQGQELFLSESKSLKGVIGKPIRYVYVDSGGVTKLMQYQFPDMPPIDWTSLEAANTERAIRDTSRKPRRARMSGDMRRVWQREWWAKNKTEQNRKRRERSRLQR